ncbi:MAG: DMT family transporter [Pseudodesulfovibrio sp.]
MKWIYVLFALVAGASMPLQAGINLKLRHSLGDPIMAALVSFAVGTLVLTVYGLSMRPIPSMAMVASAPWWAWCGGLLGAFFVSATIILAGHLGATTTMAWLLAGQFTFALVLDHYGLVSFDVHEISWPRILGVLLLFAGAYLVKEY